MRKLSYIGGNLLYPFMGDRARGQDAPAGPHIVLFAQRIVPVRPITASFADANPFHLAIAGYNRRMLKALPCHGIRLAEPSQRGGISAVQVKWAMAAGDWERVRRLMP